VDYLGILSAGKNVAHDHIAFRDLLRNVLYVSFLPLTGAFHPQRKSLS
jgi:hypothetical protein